MKKLKIFIALLIFILTGIGVLIGYLLASEEYEVHSGTATVIERRSASSVIVKLDSGEELKNELIVYTNIFTEEDSIKIDYSKIKREYKVLKVYDLEENKNRLASKIESDPTVLKYIKKISGKVNNETITTIYNIEALPIKINNQDFELLKEQEYYNILYNNKDIIHNNITEGSKVTLTLLDDFEVESIQNIDNDNRTELLHNKTDKSITFTGVGKGIYSAKIRFKNGYIINYIFD